VSKAFTRESDDAPEAPRLRPAAPLPPGVKNYITPEGERRLRGELERLLQVERPQAAGLKSQLHLADQKINQIQQQLQSAEVVLPPAPPWDRVRFGATITVRDRCGVQTRYRIVGVDETDLDRDWVSWRSPVAKALLNARPGQWVRFRVPAGEQELEIIAIAYE
jgi:transcription elongation factor GreB